MLGVDPVRGDPDPFDPDPLDPNPFGPGKFDPGCVDPGCVDPGCVDAGCVDPGRGVRDWLGTARVPDRVDPDRVHLCWGNPGVWCVNPAATGGNGLVTRRSSVTSATRRLTSDSMTALFSGTTTDGCMVAAVGGCFGVNQH